MSQIPVELRAAISLCMEEQQLALRSLNRSKTVKMMSAGMLHSPEEANGFKMYVTDYAAKSFQSRMYTPCLQWRISSHSVSTSRNTDDGCPPHKHLFSTLYRDSQTSAQMHNVEVTIQLTQHTYGNEYTTLQCTCVAVCTTDMPWVHTTRVFAMFLE